MKQFLKNNPGFSALLGGAALAVLTDLAYAAFVIIKFAMYSGGASFVTADIQYFSIAVAAVNGALVLATLIYIILRQAKKSKK